MTTNSQIKERCNTMNPIIRRQTSLAVILIINQFMAQLFESGSYLSLKSKLFDTNIIIWVLIGLYFGY